MTERPRALARAERTECAEGLNPCVEVALSFFKMDCAVCS